MKKTGKTGSPPALNRLLLFFYFCTLSFTIQAQNVTGTVTDEAGVKLAGVTVLVKGSTTGTSTDSEGKYRIVAAGNATLLFSSIGFANQEVAVNGRSVVDVTLLLDNGQMGEVVVTALGITKQ